MYYVKELLRKIVSNTLSMKIGKMKIGTKTMTMNMANCRRK